MDWTRGPGTSAAAAVMCAAALTACGGGGGAGEPDDGPTGGQRSPSTSSATSAPTPSSSAPATAEPEPEPGFPDTPAGELDRFAAEENWVLDETASAWIGTICGKLDDRKARGQSTGPWLVDDYGPTPDEEAALTAGMPELCPRWWPEVRKALGAVGKRTYTDGTYEVSGAAGQDLKLIEPGTYRTANPGENCSWERRAASGETLDSQNVTAAESATVTVQATDRFFTSKGCGTWKPVR